MKITSQSLRVPSMERNINTNVTSHPDVATLHRWRGKPWRKARNSGEKRTIEDYSDNLPPSETLLRAPTEIFGAILRYCDIAKTGGRMPTEKATLENGRLPGPVKRRKAIRSLPQSILFIELSSSLYHLRSTLFCSVVFDRPSFVSSQGDYHSQPTEQLLQ